MRQNASPINPGPPQSVVDRLNHLLTQDLEAVERILTDRAASPIAMIPDMSGYIVSAGGKRLRPMVTLAAAHLCGRCGPPAHSLAAAVEFIHTATLLHDDVVDESALRRGKPAAKALWGNKAAILVGDFLFARAFTLMVETGSLKILDILSTASTVIAQGEVRQLAAQGRLDLPTEEYLAIIEAKTAALFEAAARAGALAGGGTEKEAESLAAYGKNLGLAFQIVDDALDYGGVTSVIGKSIGDDFREGKITLPVVIARRRGSADDRAFWDRALVPSRQLDGDLSHAIALIRSTGAAEAALQEARDYVALARAALSELPDGPFRKVLADLAEFTVERVS